MVGELFWTTWEQFLSENHFEPFNHIFNPFDRWIIFNHMALLTGWPFFVRRIILNHMNNFYVGEQFLDRHIILNHLNIFLIQQTIFRSMNYFEHVIFYPTSNYWSANYFEPVFMPVNNFQPFEYIFNPTNNFLICELF
jgi:hypothetical protein